MSVMTTDPTKSRGNVPMDRRHKRALTNDTDIVWSKVRHTSDTFRSAAPRDLTTIRAH